MNKVKSILIGSLIAVASIAAVSQNANAAEVQYQHNNFHQDRVAFEDAKLLRERQAHEQKARELRERQVREQKARELRERQVREQKARELRERQLREKQAREHRNTHNH